MAVSSSEVPASSLSVWFDRVRGYAPLAATLLGLLYAFGFVIVNAYLGRYGIRELDALRTRYVGAGLLFLVFVVVTVPVASQIRADSLHRPERLRLPLILLGAFAGPWLMALFEALVLVRIEAGTFGTEIIDIAMATRVYVGLGVMNLSLVVALLLFEFAQASRHTLATRVWRGLSTWWLVITLVGVALAWSEILYPEVPPFLGGGRPEPVRLVTTQSVADACRPCVATTVLLIDADDKRIVIVAKDESGRDFAVEIFLVSGADRAVIHLPR